jgi:hypothetical protein
MLSEDPMQDQLPDIGLIDNALSDKIQNVISPAFGNRAKRATVRATVRMIGARR